jgi:hypothetical protein
MLLDKICGEIRFMEKRIRIEMELSGDEAWALAQFLKRAGYDHYRQVAHDDEEGNKMRSAGDIVRCALVEASASR